MATAELILASGSAARRKMLEAAGVDFRVVVASVDEDALRATLEPNAAPQFVASVLARAKAEEVSRRHPAALVIGADQVLALDRTIYTKPARMVEARAALGSLAGRKHHLHSAVVLARSGGRIWEHVDSATLTMRSFSDEFLDAYLKRAGERVCASVGAYELEGLGIQLFDKVEGDYFVILGMPLLALLAELRGLGIVPN